MFRYTHTHGQEGFVDNILIRSEKDGGLLRESLDMNLERYVAEKILKREDISNSPTVSETIPPVVEEVREVVTPVIGDSVTEKDVGEDPKPEQETLVEVLKSEAELREGSLQDLRNYAENYNVSGRGFDDIIEKLNSMEKIAK